MHPVWCDFPGMHAKLNLSLYLNMYADLKKIIPLILCVTILQHKLSRYLHSAHGWDNISVKSLVSVFYKQARKSTNHYFSFISMYAAAMSSCKYYHVECVFQTHCLLKPLAVSYYNGKLGQLFFLMFIKNAKIFSYLNNFCFSLRQGDLGEIFAHCKMPLAGAISTKHPENGRK